MKLAKLSLLLSLLMLVGCDPIERQAYNIVVTSKAFLDSTKAQHPECPGPGALCSNLARATGAKDLIIDAGKAYCRVDQFAADDTTPCNPYPKGTRPASLAEGALKSAIAGYNQAESDIKAVIQ